MGIAGFGSSVSPPNMPIGLSEHRNWGHEFLALARKRTWIFISVPLRR